jgi:hypothetical protein
MWIGTTRTEFLIHARMPSTKRLLPAASVPLAGAVNTPEGASPMPSMDCPNCDGTGYTQDASGEDVICPLCDGTGVLVSDEDVAGVE